jgi:hypothetical protein
VGLPQHAIPLALLFFNLGVEVGQLAFVAVVLVVGWAWLKVTSQGWGSAVAEGRFARLDVAAAYVIGTLAAYWLVERTTGFWS